MMSQRLHQIVIMLASSLLLSFQMVHPFSPQSFKRPIITGRSHQLSFRIANRKNIGPYLMKTDGSVSTKEEIVEFTEQMGDIENTEETVVAGPSDEEQRLGVSDPSLEVSSSEGSEIARDIVMEAMNDKDVNEFLFGSGEGTTVDDIPETLANDPASLLASSETVDGAEVADIVFGQGEDTFEGGQPTESMVSAVNVTEFLMGSGEDTLRVEEDDAVTSENVGVILAAAAAAEASISSDVADSIPLIPTSHSNGTVDTVTEMPAIVSAPSVVGDPPAKITPPSVKKILTFAVPAIGVWLCSPLLSLIDTSAVGLLSGTTQQAALNPAVAVTDYAALLIAFMYTATTNLVAAAQETDRGVEGKPRTTKSLISSLQLSGFVGLGLGTVLMVFARPLLRAIIGNDGISPAVFAAAMKYVRIRAIGMPAAAVIGSAQAACLGMQDIRSPLYVLAAAAVVNFFGDMMFVGCKHPLIGGAAGAAWATVFSQYAAVTFFMHWLCNRPGRTEKPKVLNISDAIMELTGKPEDKGAKRRRSFSQALKSLQVPSLKVPSPPSDVGLKRKWLSQKVKAISSRIRPEGKKQTQKKESKEEELFSARGFLEGRFRGRDLLSLPSKESMSEFAPYVLPVTTTQVGRVSSYVAMSHVVSSSLGTVSMAAQQVIVSLFYCLCPIADSLSLTAQSFVPVIAEKKASRERASALRKMGFNFLKAGAVFSSVMVGAVGCIPFLSKFFTSDPVVVSLVNSVTPLLMGVFAVHGSLCAAEGLLLGQKDLGFLGKSYAGYFAAVPWLLLRVKKAALSGAPNVNLASVWQVFLSYQLFRFCAWVGRVAMIQRRTDREAASLNVDSSNR